MKWLKNHWKWMASAACGIASVGLIPLSPIVAGGVALGCAALTAAHALDAKAFDEGKQLGELGAAEKAVLEQQEKKK